MKSAGERGLVMAKLEDGEDLFASLSTVVKEHGIGSGAVLWGIGMVRDFEVGYYDGKAYRRRAFAEPHELLALHGSLTPSADPPLHLHVAAGGPTHAVVGGHLFRATVNVLSELCLAPFESIRLGRALSPRSGLRELTVDDGRSGSGAST